MTMKMSGFDPDKNPIMQLHELYKDISYEFEQNGPVHQATFIARAKVNGVLFVGTGVSKVKAKVDLALRALTQLGNPKARPEPQKAQSFQPISSLKGTIMPDIVSMKRKAEEEEESIKKMMKMSGFDPDKSPVMQLHELYKGVAYEFEQEGPTFIAKATVNGVAFQGAGISKAKAKIDLALRALSQLGYPMARPDIEKAQSHPVMVLAELFPEMKVEWIEGGKGDRQYRMETEIYGRTFWGEGRSKKMAKLNLAKTVLLCMYDIRDFKDSEVSPKAPKPKTEGSKKKYPTAELKELVEEEIKYELVKVEGMDDSEEKMFNCSVVIKGVAYEGQGKTRASAKFQCAKKALAVLKPDTEGKLNEDVEMGSPDKKHPSMVFNEMFKGVKISELKTKGERNMFEYQMDAEIEGKSFSSKSNSKKKAKLRLVLAVLEQLRDMPQDSWSSIDLKDVYEDKVPVINPPATKQK